jgi:hypothetical protein
MQTAIPAAEPVSDAVKRPSKGRNVTGWILTGFIILAMLLDAAIHLTMPVQVLDAFRSLGLPNRVGPEIGVILLIATLLYAVPRTAVLGAALLTGYFGGAIAIHLRAGSPPFETVFPALLGLIAWTGIYLREPRLASVFPFRK